MSTALAARGLTKRFGADGVLEGVDLTVADDEVLVLMGPNGVGKSVLLACLAGSEPATDGEVAIQGATDGHPGDQLAFLAQETMAIETLTGRENARFYAGLHPAFTDRWRDYVERFALTDELDKLVNHYSGGMRRKLELALTLSIDVPIYLLDEPTAGVDLTMTQRFHDVILERHHAGAAVVLSSHNPLDATIADRIAFVVEGGIGAVGSPTALMDDVPPVVRLTGTEAMATAGEYVAGGELFPLGGEVRGFLAEGVAVDDLRRGLGAAGHDDVTVETITPTHADMFNYHVHVAGGPR